MDEMNLNMQEEEVNAEAETVKEEDMTDIENDVYEFESSLEEKPKSFVDKLKGFGVKVIDFAVDHPMLTKCVAIGSGALLAYGIGVKVGEKNALDMSDDEVSDEDYCNACVEIGRAFGKAEAMDALAEIARKGSEISDEK